MRRSPTVLADMASRAAVAAVALALLAAGCAGAAATTTAGAGTDTIGVQERLDALYQRITGTLDDRKASAMRSYVAYQLPIRMCMAAAGFDYTPPPLTTFDAWPANRPMSYIDILVPIDAANVARGLYLTEDAKSAVPEPANPGFTQLDEPGRRRYMTQAQICSPPPGTSESEFPAGALNLAYTLEGDLARALAAAPELKDAANLYPACMAKAGYPIQDRKALADLIRDQHFNTGAILSETQLAAGLAAEQEAARADASCRADTYPSAMALAGPVVDSFTHKHAKKLTQLDAAWSDIRHQATTDQEKITW